MCIIYSILTIKYAGEKNVIMKIVRFVSYSNCCKSPKVFPIIIEKYPCVSGPMQFKLVLFKSQLYCTQLKRLVAWKVNCYLIVCCGMQEKSQNIAEYCRILKYRKGGVSERWTSDQRNPQGLSGPIFHDKHVYHDNAESAQFSWLSFARHPHHYGNTFLNKH